MQLLGIILFIGIPVFLFIVLPMAFLNELDRQNPSNPDMW